MEDEKKSNHKGFKIFLLIFALISMILLGENNRNKLLRLLKLSSGKELKLVETYQPARDLIDLNFHSGNIYQWTGDKISIMKTNGTIVMEKAFNFSNPYLSFGSKNIYIMDRSTGDLYLLNNKGETIEKIQLNKEIFNIREDNENIIVHTKTPEEEGIRLLNKEGLLINNLSYEDKNILSYGLNKDANIIAISLLEYRDGDLKSEIQVLDENSLKLYDLKIENEIVVYLQVLDDKELICLTDRSLYYIKSGKTIWTREFDLIKDLQVKGGKVFILHSNYLEVIALDGKSELKHGFTTEYNRMILPDKRILLYGHEGLVVIDGEKEILKHKENIKSLHMDKNKILIWTDEKVNLYEIVNRT